MSPVATHDKRRMVACSVSPGIPALVAMIRKEIAAGGPMTYARFMELALYHPQWGYYTRQPEAGHEERIGWTGDFYTSSDVHTVLGWALASQIEQVDRLLGSPARFTVVEMGPGKGLLARDILSACAERFPNLFDRLRYLLVDRSPAHRASQRAVLSGRLNTPCLLDWLDSLDQIGHDSLTGVILSNELVDAFPIHRVEMAGGTLRERYVTVTEGRLSETYGPLSSPDLERYFDRLGISLPEESRTEVNLHAVAWIQDVAARLRQGLVITIDYGHTARDLYAPERSTGTLRSYSRHTVSDDPLISVGEQDLTSHVDFTSLARAGEEAGLIEAGFTNQMSFLISLGIEAYCAALPPDSPDIEAIAHLMRPHGMGTTFKVLFQQKGLPSVEWQGLRHRSFFESILGSRPIARE